VISEAEGTAEAVERDLIEQRRKDKWGCHEVFESEKRIKKLQKTQLYILGGEGKSGAVTQAAEYSRIVLGHTINVPP
jgi:hypothetical protein